MPTPEARLSRWQTSAYAVWAIIGGLLLCIALGWVVGRISGALAPFVIGFLIVFLLQGPVEWLESRGTRRSLAVAICFVVGFTLFSAAVILLFPVVARQLVAFAAAVPGALDKGQAFLVDLQTRFTSVVFPLWINNVFESVVKSVGALFVGIGDIVAKGILGFGGGLATVVFDLFLAMVVSFWTLRDLPTIRRELKTLAGEKYEADLENLLSTVGRVVGGYLRGQTIASLCTGAIAAIGLGIIGVPYALVLGIVTFIGNYVPYAGPVFAGMIAAVVGFFVSPLKGILAIVIVVAAQQLTDLFVTPRVMSDQVDLHPTLVIFSLLVGGTLFGFWGMIFSIPVAATAKGLFVYYYERRTSRQLGTEEGALFKTTQCDDDSDEPCEDDVKPDEGASSAPE